MPSTEQTRSIGPDAGSTTYISSFLPTHGGRYVNEYIRDESTLGFWWGSTAYNGAARYILLYYNDDSLYTDYGYGRRYSGFYIRCVSEEKDVQDLTYMQDMTPSIAANTMKKIKSNKKKPV